MNTGSLLLAVHLLATAAMTGLIWFVQVVHYPLFAGVGADRFAPYAVDHQRRTSYVVALPMAVEGISALALVAAPPSGVSRWLALAALALLGVVLLATVTVQVPIHAALVDGFDERRVERLVATNWVRTFGWSLRSVLAVVMIAAT